MGAGASASGNGFKDLQQEEIEKSVRDLGGPFEAYADASKENAVNGDVIQSFTAEGGEGIDSL